MEFVGLGDTNGFVLGIVNFIAYDNSRISDFVFQGFWRFNKVVGDPHK